MPKRRKLSPFLCREMLYEYEIGLLDPERQSAVEEFMQADADCREELESLRAAFGYAEQLGQTEVRLDIVAHLREAENAVSLSKKYASWRNWPETLRWASVALMVSVVVAAFVAAVPWNQLQKFGPVQQTTVLKLADLTGAVEDDSEAEPESEVAEDDQGSGDWEVDAEGSPVQVAEASEGRSQPQSEPDATPVPSPTPVTMAVAATPTPVPTPKEAKPKGFVYRAFMNLGNLEEIGPKIAEHIVELGGAKAGEVELGWKRGAGRYYHFSLPEENEEKLLEKLRAYGPVRMSKDPHPRVMPPGQVRFILWIEPL